LWFANLSLAAAAYRRALGGPVPGFFTAWDRGRRYPLRPLYSQSKAILGRAWLGPVIVGAAPLVLAGAIALSLAAYLG
jgi:hypothetical protein